MTRGQEIREAEREIRKGKGYNFHEWLHHYVIPSGCQGWNFVIVSGGDVREKMNLSHSSMTQSRCRVVEIDSVPHTVIEVRNRFLKNLERARDLRGFYSLLSSLVLSDRDIRTFHYDLWLAAHNLESKVQRLTELRTRNFRRQTEVERDVFAHNSVRESARHYGAL